jgi:hypothetical protein
MVKCKIIHGDTNQCFLTSIYAKTKMFISSNIHWISFVILYDLNKVGRFECSDYLESYAISGISSWLGHLCNSSQRVGAWWKLALDPTGWGLGVKLTNSPWKTMCGKKSNNRCWITQWGIYYKGGQRSYRNVESMSKYIAAHEYSPKVNFLSCYKR